MSKERKIIIAVIVAIALIAGAVAWLGWSGNTRDIEATADQLQVDSSWKVLSSHSEPPRTLCIAQACPNLGRVWDTEKVVSVQVVTDILNKSGWNNVMIDNQDCFRKITDIKYNLSCSVSARAGKYSVRIFIDNDNSLYDTPTLTLSVKA